jgi:hypothetical protein
LKTRFFRRCPGQLVMGLSFLSLPMPTWLLYCVDAARRIRGHNLPTPTTNAAPSAAAT